jgi:hypothetical protein
MEARTTGEPFLATLQISIKFPLPVPTGAFEPWDHLMEKLLGHPSIVDPVVSDDPKSGDVIISFDFEATGNVQEDVLKAITFLEEATHTDEPAQAFDWEHWLSGPSSAGTVQYPVYA